MEYAQVVLGLIASCVLIVAAFRLMQSLGKRDINTAEQRRFLFECGLLTQRVAALEARDRRLAVLEARVAELTALIPRPEQ